MGSSTTDRERFIDVFEYRSVDRVPNWEAGSWGQTKERWISEGLDELQVNWDWWYGDDYWRMDHRLFVPINFGMIPPFESKVIEESDRYEIYIDGTGRTRKALKEGRARGTRSSMDEFIEFPVTSRDDFRRLKKRFQPLLDQRYPENWRQTHLPGWRESTLPRILAQNAATRGFYWRPREWMGTEGVSYAWYDMPDLMHEMMEFIGDFTIEVATPILEEMDFEYVMIAEDMSMKSGPLLGPDTFRTFIYPHLVRLITFLKSKGVRYVMVDTDGDPDPLIPLLLDAGVDAIWPIERAANHMDPLELRRRYGKDLRLFGGVDKRELAKSKKAIDEHLRTLIPLVEEGGFIPTVDHTVPPDVSLANFAYYMQRKMDLLEGRI